MGEINIQGLGRVRIQGDAPTPEEEKAILDAISGAKPAPQTMPDQGYQVSPQGLRPEDMLLPDQRPYLTQLTGGWASRPTFEAAGGTLGALAGGGVSSPTGPGAIAGALVGGGLGAGAGSAAFDTADAAARWIGGQGSRNESPLAPTLRALKAGKEDVVWGGAAMSLGPVFKAFKSGAGKALGVGSDAVKAVGRQAENMGIPLGTLQATDRKGLKGITRVLGVFPFVGTPIKKSAAESGVAIASKFDDTLNTLAPNATMADLGVDLTDAAKGRFAKFKNVAGALYDRFYTLADEATVKEIFPTDDIVKVADDMSGARVEGTIVLKTQKRLVSPAADPLEDFISDLRDLPDKLTAKQLRQLQRDLQETATKMQKDGHDLGRLMEIKKALESSLNSPDISLLAKEEGERIANSLTNANAFYAENIKRFQTATAKKFGRVDRNIFGSGFFKAGSKDADEIYSAVFNSKSPQALSDLRSLVGRNEMQKATRKFFQESFNAAGGADVGQSLKAFDVDKFANTIGLGTKEGRQGLEEMLKGTGTRVGEIEAFLDVARKAGSITIPDTSTFIQRRVTIGGLRNILGGVALGAVGINNPVGTVAGILLTRHGAKIMSRPATLRNLSRALDDAMPDIQRRALILRVAREVMDLGEENGGNQ